MNNKLGLNEQDLEVFEEQLFNFKSSLIDYRVTFNESEFNLSYLIKLHNFLFGDLYDNDNISDRFKDDSELLDKKIKELVSLIEYEYEDIEYINNMITELINMQIFDDGNNRTINCFIKNVVNSYRDKNPSYYDLLLNDSKKL